MILIETEDRNKKERMIYRDFNSFINFHQYFLKH
ncbi:hypothetical protein DN410_06240 [Bacillus sp. SH5-2]|nr:hypothetical protein DN410_06240 [Bacillus sp. SH5-2]